MRQIDADSLKPRFIPHQYYSTEAILQKIDSAQSIQPIGPRMLTLEEVQMMGRRNMERGKSPYETCIYERRGGSRLEICSPLWDEPQFEGDESHLDIQYLFIGTDEYDIVPVKKYGWEIRCWYGCPTDDQLEATAWEGT